MWSIPRTLLHHIAECLVIRDVTIYRISYLKFCLCLNSLFQDGSCNGLQHYAALGRDSVRLLLILVPKP